MPRTGSPSVHAAAGTIAATSAATKTGTERMLRLIAQPPSWVVTFVLRATHRARSRRAAPSAQWNLESDIELRVVPSDLSATVFRAELVDHVAHFGRIGDRLRRC